MTSRGEPDPRPWFDEPLPEVDIEVDARGLLCPLPIVKLSQALRRNPKPVTIKVISTDSGFFPDLIRWIRVRKETLVALRKPEPGEWCAWVRSSE